MDRPYSLSPKRPESVAWIEEASITGAVFPWLRSASRSSDAKLTLILGTLCVGIAFVIKGLFGVRKLDREESRKKGKAASDKLNEYDNM